MISNSGITLCCVDTEHHRLSTVALRRCNEVMPFAKTIFVTDLPDYVDPGWEHHRIKKLSSYDEYNRFMLKSLYFHIETDYVLSVQFDGFIINPDSWTDEFLQYDYIGAPWHLHNAYTVGSGGFSLRSRRLLMALQDDRIFPAPDDRYEDLCFCRTYRSYLEVRYGIRFAPAELASRFSYESGPLVADPFGFHGLPWLADFYTGEAARHLIGNLQPYLLRGASVIMLAMQYAVRERHEEAALLFNRIAAHQTYEGARNLLCLYHLPPGNIEYLAQCWPRYIAREAA
jgi:hypothetical protein